MKKIYIGIYSAIAALVIFGTIFGFIYGLKKDAEKGSDDAIRNFNFFAKSVIAFTDKDIFAEFSYKEKLNRLADELDITAFVLSSGGSKTIMSWSKEPDLITYTQDAGFSVKTVSPFIKYLNAEINVKTPDNPAFPVKLSAALQTVKPDSIFARSRTVFFAALTVFLLTLMIILFQNLSAQSEKVYTELPSKDQELKDYIFGEDLSEKLPEYTPPENVKTTVPKKTDIDSKEYILEDLDNLSIYKKFPYEKETLNKYEEPQEIKYISEIEETDSQTNIQEQKETDKISGLYSPITGIAYKEHLGECLEMELKRAASSEQDLALLVVRLKDFSLESLVAKKIVEVLVGIIKFKDRIFEFGEDGFAAILQDTNLDTAMKVSEEIFRGIKKILDEYKISEPIALGITTRTSRLLSADRFIDEAKAATSRAMSSPDDPIVAFKVDPEQYRKFISETL